MAEQRRLIIVDDEPAIGQMVLQYLGRHGYDVRVATGGRELDTFLASEPADLLILDVNMPGEDGFAIARRMQASAIPILMLTSADEVVDRVVGLEIGADDYMVKPFDLRELRARVAAILRRARRDAVAPIASPTRAVEPDRTKVQFGHTFLDLTRHQLLLADGTIQPLTAMEFDLLEAFSRHPDQVLSRDRLLDLAHHRGSEPFDRSIDIRIARIRRKVESDPSKPKVIKTIHGAGYMFVSAAR
jgi:two-component system, OmpR family, response regulator